MNPRVFYTLITVIFMAGCYPQRSFVLIGETQRQIVSVFEDDGLFFTDEYTKRYITKDTFVVGYYRERQPMESLFIFKDDTCYYQETKIYCSPCANQLLKEILRDRTFKFEHVGGVNYQSKKNKNIIMRLKRDNENGTCSELKVVNTEKTR